MSVKVVELFAGVGGFRVGLNDVKLKDNVVFENNKFNFVFYNQWEPNNKSQYAYKCYSYRFNEIKNPLNNVDISLIDKSLIPDHDLLVGGFPCQDYSVAKSIVNEKGIHGKKGVLWWQIYDLLKSKNTNFVLLENVDRLLKCPSKQRGKDFAIILKCFEMLDYYVEWKTINSADYGMPQKRNRIFIFACKKSTFFYKENIENVNNINTLSLIKNKKSFFINSFDFDEIKSFPYQNNKKSIDELCDSNIDNQFIFYDFGFMKNNKIYTSKTKPIFNGNRLFLKDVLLENDKDIEKFIIDDKYLDKLIFLKGAKSIKRMRNGYEYTYREGQIGFPDDINKPSRTLLTSEGVINRTTHIIKANNNKLRKLSPIECERLNMFPDDWTNINNLIPDRNRNFLMGNALVCGIISKLAPFLHKIITQKHN